MVPELTPEIVRRFCRELGGSTNSQASDVEDACFRFLSGLDVESVIYDIQKENEGD